MKWDVDTRVWQNTPKGDVTVVCPRQGLEIVSVRSWRDGFSGCGPMLTLVTSEAPGILGVRVSGRPHAIGEQQVLLVGEGELFEIKDGVAFSVLYLDQAVLGQTSAGLSAPLEPLYGAYVLGSTTLSAALHAILASAASGDATRFDEAFANTARALLDCLRRATGPGSASA